MAQIHPSRYQQVRQILNDAAQDSPVDYGGVGRFWDQDVDILKSARLHGIPMIAPETPPACCSHTSGATDGPRSAASGLIQGLRGERPFDGSRFPPLPWGGKRVAAADIQVIADWIDGGCLDDGQPSAAASMPLHLATEDMTHILVRDNSEFGLAPAGA